MGLKEKRSLGVRIVCRKEKSKLEAFRINVTGGDISMH